MTAPTRPDVAGPPLAHTSPQSSCMACPPPSGMGEPLNPCPRCGEHTNEHITATAPECPHGWEQVAGDSDLAELYTEAWSLR